ncbi:GNAT family N-acetyltransferase [Arthrobacter sp. efr-133-TYG-118]|uniref:GNAT family N-acetyltransferase n=1 Tax=Arthrobacter sp. efr-133-TYG-118 TaxID=3040279 RepID=UPI003305FF5B
MGLDDGVSCRQKGGRRKGVGSELLTAVIKPEVSTGLWVADPNRRAQAFYRSMGRKLGLRFSLWLARRGALGLGAR